jgi:hypothetical protein
METMTLAHETAQHIMSELPKASQTREYISKTLLARPGELTMELMVHRCRMELEKAGAKVLSVQAESLETIRDPDTTVRALFYRIRARYTAPKEIKLNLQD